MLTAMKRISLDSPSSNPAKPCWMLKTIKVVSSPSRIKIASLTIQENADPTVLSDLEHFMNKLVPEFDPDYRHTIEGPDDMPAHIRSALTQVSEQIPVSGKRLMLGTWQGIFLWEHRRHGRQRKVVVNLFGNSEN